MRPIALTVVNFEREVQSTTDQLSSRQSPRVSLSVAEWTAFSVCCNSIHARLPASRTQTRRLGLGCPFLIRSSPPVNWPLGDTGRALTSLSRRLWLGSIVPCFPCTRPGPGALPAGPCSRARDWQPRSPTRLLQPVRVQGHLESLASSLPGEGGSEWGLLSSERRRPRRQH